MQEGEGGYKPVEAEQSPEIPQLREGLSAVVLPKELMKDDPMEGKVLTEQEKMKMLNGFLEKLNEQGATIVGMLDIGVNRGGLPGVIGDVVDPAKVVIVRKEPRSEQLPPSELSSPSQQ